nr:CD3324 family protein [uncultured Acetatifactor sp.]
MGYRKAEEILPIEIIELIQQYVDGENIYIPRKSAHRQAWGTGTQIKQELLMRNQQIYKDYLAGSKTSELACKYYLSKKSIQRILKEYKSILEK